MYQIQTLNKISHIGLDVLGDDYTIGNEVANPDAILVRSAAMHEMELPATLKAIARAGAGVNNIPIDRCTEQGIVVFNTPGANANAVKELVIAGLLISSRKVVQGMEWVQNLKGKGDEVAKLVEKGKSQFAGPEIKGKKLGVIGLGAIGVRIANAATSLGLEVYGYDPYLSVDAAWGLYNSVHQSKSLNEIFSDCDYITLHVPLTPDTKHLINADAIGMMKKDVRILNFARGGLVNDDAIIDALNEGRVAAYVTDFPNDNLLGVPGVLAIPHLGASTPESEDNCAYMAARQVKDFLENGNIVNSVNLPSVDMPRATDTRVCVIHRNVQKMLSTITDAVSSLNINIENMQSKSKKDYAYTILDVAGGSYDGVAEAISALGDVIKAWVIK